MNLALFDLDHTLLPLDSDYEWGRFLVRHGLVDVDLFERRNADFYAQYQAGTLDPVEYLDFALGTLASFPRERLLALRDQYMSETIVPALRPEAQALVAQHRAAGDLVAIVTATNHFVTEPIAAQFAVDHLIAAEPDTDAEGKITGRLRGIPTQGEGKVIRTREWLSERGQTLSDFDKSYFYSDSHNDIPLLSVVTHPVATNPNEKLSMHAHTAGWPILKLFND